MGKAAVAKAFEDIKAALAVLNAEVDECGSEPFSDADPLAGLADGCLDILAGARVVEAGFAGLKARAAVTYADTAQAIAPDAPVQAQEMAVAAEIGCLLALGSRAAGAFLAASHALCKELPPTLSALQAGTITWQHALAMVDETATLDPAGAAALEAYFLDPDAPRPPTAAPIGELPAYRFKAKARNWRERHHAESIEKRHARGVADRRVEYRPDQDGMAWLSAYLPADQALAGWNRLTALARGMQGPDEPRTLTQLKADNFTEAILGTGNHSGCAGAGGSDGNSARQRHRCGNRRRCGGWPVIGDPRPGAGHRPGILPDGPNGRAGDAGRVWSDPAVDGAQTRRRGAFVLPGAGGPEGRGAAGDRPDKVPDQSGHAELA
jgi:hypothetical protein